jgi:hypothetical protein
LSMEKKKANWNEYHCWKQRVSMYDISMCCEVC